MARLACLVVVSILVGVVAVPAGATIIDIDAVVNTNLNPVDLALAAGTYTVTPIGTADGGAYNAWNAWGAVVGCDATGENCVNGWLNNYSLASSEWGPVLVTDNGKYGTPLLALAHAQSTTFTLASAGTVHFFELDCCYSDNLGGMSLNVEAVVAPVPEPGTLTLLALGVVGLGAVTLPRRRRFVPL